MTQVDRLARELHLVVKAAHEKELGYVTAPWERATPIHRSYFLALARHVLRRERAARGRTLGYVSHVGYEPLLTRAEAQGQVDVCGGVVARVVAVPKRKKGGCK